MCLNFVFTLKICDWTGSCLNVVKFGKSFSFERDAGNLIFVIREK